MNVNGSTTKDFSDSPMWLRITHGSLLALLLTASIAGNCVVLGAVTLHKKLQQRSFIASLGLVVADLVLASTSAAQGIASVAVGYAPFGEIGCTVFGTVTSMAISARWCFVATIIFDRFCSIFFPFWYRKRSKEILIALNILSWLSAFIIIIPGLSGFGSFEFSLEQSACLISCRSDRACFIYYALMFGFFLCIGSIFPVVLYLILCLIGIRKAHKTKNIKLGKFDAEMESTASFTYTNPSVAATPQNLLEVVEDDHRKMSICSMATIASSTSGQPKSPQGFNSHSSEVKAIKTFFMIFVNVLTTQLPIYVFSLLRSSRSLYDSIPLYAHLLILHVYLLGIALDPLLILKNQEVRQVLKSSMKKRAARNFNKTNTAILLLEMAKMSSLHKEVKEAAGIVGGRGGGGGGRGRGGGGIRYGRRHSCPNIHQHKMKEVVISPLATSSSCSHCAPENSDTADMIMKLEELEELKHEGRRGSRVTIVEVHVESTKDCKENFNKVLKTVEEDED